MLQVIDTFPPYCYPIDYTIDRIRLNESFCILMKRLGASIDSHFSVNLTHLPGITGNARWNQNNSGHQYLVDAGIDASDFTELLEEVKDLYLGQVIRDITKLHKGIFQGRYQLTVMAPKKNYGRHIDVLTPSRYHIPLITNEDCYWVFCKDNQFYKLTMPADNRVWFLDPVNIEHDFYNNSNSYRWHLILTSSVD
jgi:hypothetical protein